ncbi:hypothetical protein D3C83_13090 [compost metagenome]
MEAEITDRPGVDAALDRFQLVDDFHGAYFWRPGHGPRRKCRAQHVDRAQTRFYFCLDVRNDVHHVRIAFDHHLLGHVHGAGLRHAPDIVAPEIDQHDVLGAFLRVGQQLIGEGGVFRRRCAAPPGAGDGAHRDGVAFETHQDFG